MIESMNDDNTIMVTVICLSYNHEKYIRDTFEGIIKQKTTFKFDVVVHDDASTDSSREIIEEYQKKYPDIIKPILQTDNQFSKGVDFEEKYIIPKCSGKYIAYCECDDYWIDESKLQKQVDFLEKHSEYSVCGHRHYVYNCRTNKKSISNNDNTNHTVDFKVISDWSGAQFHTSSYLFRRELLCVPQSMKMKNVGNYPRLVWLALNGRVYQFAEVMSVYRIFTNGSWSQGNTSGDVLGKRVDRLIDCIGMLEGARELSPECYRGVILNTIGKYYAELECLNGNYKVVKDKYNDYYKQFSLKKRASLFIASCNPKLWNNLKRKGF